MFAAIRRAWAVAAKPLAQRTNGFALSPVRAVFSDGNVGLSNRQWSMSVFHRRPVQPKELMPLGVTLKRSFRVALEPSGARCPHC